MDEYQQAPWRQSIDPSPGLVIGGRYRLEEHLRTRNEIATWRGLDQGLARPVLIHLVHGDDERFGWMLQAARTAAGIEDPRFLRVLDAAPASGQEPWSYLVCEYAVGDSLASLLSVAPLTSRQAGLLIGQLAEALAPQHVNGCFHQCLGPDEVVITPNGNVKISGFLVDAAAAELGQREWSLAQRADVRALGSLLYAALSAHWPVSPTSPQRPVAGLAPAPLQGLPPASEQFWCSPTLLNPQADPELSNIALAALRSGQGLVGPSLHTAAELRDALISVVGDQGADEALESMMSGRVGRARVVSPSEAVTEVLADVPTPASLADLEPTTRLVVQEPVMEPTTRIPATQVSEPDDESTRINPAIAHRPQPTLPTLDPHEPRTERIPAVTDEDEDAAPSRFDALQERVREGIPQLRERIPTLDDLPRPDLTRLRSSASTVGKRIPELVRGSRPAQAGAAGLAVLLILFVVLGVRSCGTAGGQGTEPVSPQPVPVAEAYVLDPTADGGDQTENMADAPLAVDGDPATAWHTLVYYNNPKFGGLKPGVGLVLDLGEAASVHEVTLTLINEHSGVQLMVPADGSLEAAPMDSVTQWNVVASQEDAATTVTLTPDVTTRFLLVYFTSLPAVADAQYQSGIAEITITS